MALLRKLFARKAMDGLAQISERVYVFNSCLSTETLGEDEYRDYLSSIIIQLKSCYPHASFMVFNFMEGDKRTEILDSLLQYGVAITDYPRQYMGCPLLPLETIREFLSSSVNWLISDRQRNILLMHCETGAWPALAFMLSSLLVCLEHYASELKMMEMVYRRAPMELLSLSLPLNPQPSHLRYLQYVTRLRSSINWAIKEGPFILECLILRIVPNFDGNGGCRPMVRIHSREPSAHSDTSPKILFCTPKIKKQFKQYKQAESAVIKINTDCQVQGDVVIECIHVGDNTEREEIMFRIMFNTAFVQSNMMVFALNDIDLAWNYSKDQFPEDFKIEVFFSELELSDTDSPTAEILGEIHDERECSSIGNPEEFYDFDEILVGSDLNSTINEWHTETSRHNEDPEADINTEEEASKVSDTASDSSEQKANSSTGDGTEINHEAEITTLSKNLSSEAANNLQEDGCSSAIEGIVTTNKDLNPEGETKLQENGSSNMTEGISTANKDINPEAETNLQQEVCRSTDEVNLNNEARIGTLQPQPIRKTWQHLKKQTTIIPPTPIIKKKPRKPDIVSDEKKVAKGKMLLKETLQEGTPIVTSTAIATIKHSTSQARRTPTPHKEHAGANSLKHSSPQETRTPTPRKEHVSAIDSKHSSPQSIRTPTAHKDHASETTSELKPATFTIDTSPSSPPSPPNVELNQETTEEHPLPDPKPSEATKKSPIHSSLTSRTPRTPKQKTTRTPADAPRRSTLLKKSSSSPAISQTPPPSSAKKSILTALPQVKLTSTGSALPAIAPSSPRLRAHTSPSPSSPRSPLVMSKVDRTPMPVRGWALALASAPQAMTRRGALTPPRSPHASLSTSRALTPTRVSNGHSLAPRASKVMQHHPTMLPPSSTKHRTRSLSPLSPRTSNAKPVTRSSSPLHPRAPPSPTSTAAASNSKDSTKSSLLNSTTRLKGSGTTPTRPTRLSS